MMTGWGRDLFAQMFWIAGILFFSSTVAAQPYVKQVAVLFENDDGPSADENSSMASTDATRVEIRSGQRMTVRFALVNTGTTEEVARFSLQQDNGDGAWAALGEVAGLSPSLGLADTNGAPLTFAKTAACSSGYVWGTWWMGTNTAPAVTLAPGECTELAFVIHSGRAEPGQSYRLRLWNRDASLPLDEYVVIPEITIATAPRARHSKQSGAWPVAATLASAVPTQLDAFGYVVSFADIDGDDNEEVIVGAPGDDTVGANVGRLYVYRYDASDSTLAFIEALDHPEPTNGDELGTSLDTGDVNGDGLADIVVGSPGHDRPGGAFNVGAAVVFVAAAGGGFESAVLLTDPTPTSADKLGTSVVLADINGDGKDDVIAGAPGDDTLGQNIGQVHIFYRNATNDGFEAALTIDSPTYAPGHSSDALGTALAAADLEGDGKAELVVGAPTCDNDGPNVGQVYIFRHRDGGGFDWEALTLSDPNGGENFGVAVALGDFNGDGLGDVAVGAHLDDTLAPDQGRVQVFVRAQDDSAFLEPLALEPGAPTPYAHFGWTLATGDLNDDGADDILVGAVNDSLAGSTAGRVFVFVRNAENDGFDSPFPLNDPVITHTDRFGRSIAVGSPSGGGWPIVAVGAPGDDSLGTDTGNLLLFDTQPAGDGTFFLDERGYTSTTLADGLLDSIVSLELPAVLTFRVPSSAISDVRAVRWAGLSTAPRDLRLQRYHVRNQQWEEVTRQLAAPLVTMELVDDLPTDLSPYVDGDQMVSWRVVQDDGSQILLSDGLLFHVKGTSDLAPPVQSAHEPASGSALAASDVELRFLLDEQGQCRWSLSPVGYFEMTEACYPDFSALAQTCPVTALEDGADSVYLACRDTKGNSDTAETITEITYTVDTMAPPPLEAVELTDDDSNTGLDGRDVHVSWTMPADQSDIARVALYVLPAAAQLMLEWNEPLVILDPTSTDWRGSQELTTDSLGQPWIEGDYQAYVISIDSAGHQTSGAPSAVARLSDDSVQRASSPDGDGCGCDGTGGGVWWIVSLFIWWRQKRWR